MINAREPIDETSKEVLMLTSIQKYDGNAFFLNHYPYLRSALSA